MNESAVLLCVHRQEMVICIYQCGLTALRTMPRMAGSPGAVWRLIPEKNGCHPGSPFVVATVEIKTKVSDNKVSHAFPYATPEVSVVDMGPPLVSN